MDEVASVTVLTKPFLVEVLALLSLVLVICLLVLLELLRSVSEFTSMLVGAVA